MQTSSKKWLDVVKTMCVFGTFLIDTFEAVLQKYQQTSFLYVLDLLSYLVVKVKVTSIVNISRNHFSFSVYHIHVPEKSYEILKM
jgi:hypothetical protein